MATRKKIRFKYPSHKVSAKFVLKHSVMRVCVEAYIYIYIVMFCFTVNTIVIKLLWII